MYVVDISVNNTLKSKAHRKNALLSAYITLQGYILTSLASLVVYPLFGIPLVISTALQIGIVLTVVAFASNYIALKVINKFENKEK